jgi:regulator of replication initiation timing
MDDDGLVDTSPAFKEFTVIINSPPDTEITQAPNATASTRDAYFEWTGTDIDGTVASYGYRLDSSEWVNTTDTNLTLLNLSSGNHTFRVRAIDNRGDTDPTPAQANFTIPPTWCESELARLNGIIDSLGDRISELESIITNLTSLLESSEEDNQALRAVIQQLEDEKADLQGQVAHLAGEKSSLLSQLASLVEENAGLEVNLTLCHDLSAALQQQVQNLTMTISQLLDENSQLELDREQLQELVEELQERIRELEAQIPQTPVQTLLVLVLLPGIVASRLRREP